MMNILLTCSGRRNYLVEYFKNALNGEGKVYTVNSTTDATSMLVSDGAILAPAVFSESYIDFLLSICRKYEIGLMVSLYDIELPVLSKNRRNFEEIGVCLTVPDFDIVDICNDKMKTYQWLKAQNLSNLFTTLDLEDAYQRIRSTAKTRMYIKPRWGMGSLNIELAENEEDLSFLFQRVKRTAGQSNLKHLDGFDSTHSVIIQEEAEGEEYGLDVVNDLKGNHITTFIKRKVEMRHGETFIAETTDIPELMMLGEKATGCFRCGSFLGR